MKERKLKTSVIATVVIEGTHNWPKVHIKEVDYLKHEHRHLFKIKACATVTHDDRDQEFIALGHSIKSLIEGKFYNVNKRLCEFGAMSCEMIAKLVMDEYALVWCEVWEDDENGARVEL